MQKTMKDEQRRYLETCTINSVAAAVDAFEEKEGLMLCQIQPSSLFSRMVPFFTVPEGYYALVQRGGRFADYHGSSTWPAGIHFGPPWMRVSRVLFDVYCRWVPTLCLLFFKSNFEGSISHT